MIMPILLLVLKWIHVLAMVGILGGLLVYQCGLPAETRNHPDHARAATRLWNILLGIGILAGLLLYGLQRGHTLGAHYNGVIGVKVVVVLALGALLPMCRRPDRGDAMRWTSAALLALAALAGLSL